MHGLMGVAGISKGLGRKLVIGALDLRSISTSG